MTTRRRKGDARFGRFGRPRNPSRRERNERARAPADRSPTSHTPRTRRLTDDLEGLTAEERAKTGETRRRLVQESSPLFCRLRKVYRTRQGPGPERRLGGEPPSRGRRECSGTRNTIIYLSHATTTTTRRRASPRRFFPSTSRRVTVGGSERLPSVLGHLERLSEIGADVVDVLDPD